MHFDALTPMWSPPIAKTQTLGGNLALEFTGINGRFSSMLCQAIVSIIMLLSDNEFRHIARTSSNKYWKNKYIFF